MAEEKLKELTVQQLVQQLQEASFNRERFCFILGAGASVSSGIPSGNTWEMRWMNCIMGEEKDCETPPMNADTMRKCAEELKEKKFLAHDFAEIEKDWREAKAQGRSMQSKYYFDLYKLRFYSHPRNGYRYLERIMEESEPSIGYLYLSLLLTENNQSNLVITTNFDDLVERSLFYSQNKKYPLIISHESMAGFLNPRADRPIIAKIHRGLFYGPLNTSDETSELMPPWKEALRDVFREYTPIVIGYAGGDESLMKFLKDEKDRLIGLFWCYYKPDDKKDYLPSQDILELLKETDDACLVPIKGFDELMLSIVQVLYPDKIDPDNMKKNIFREAENTFKQYENKRQMFQTALSPGISSAELSPAQQAEEEKREKAGELTAWDYFRRGFRAYNEGNFPKAIEEYNEAIDYDPVNARIYVNRGAAYAEGGKPNEAIADFSKAIELDPDDAAAYYNRGLAYAKVGKDDEAIADYSKAIELNPDLAEAYNNRGKAYKDSHKSEEAITDYGRAIELNPDLAAAYVNRGAAYNETGRNREAIADYDRAIKLNPDLAEAYYNRGNAYDDLKQYDEAIVDYNEAIRIDPNLAAAYINRGSAYGKDGKPNEAIADFSKAIELDPNYALAYNNRALAYRALGKIGLAEADEIRAEELRNQKNKK